MFGKSGCGQTTLLSYLTENYELVGTDSMSTQQFSAETFQLPSDTGMTNIRINESPGMCSGLEVEELQKHWNHLISRVNKEGGVSVFLLLIKANVRITSQFIDEIEEFSELYFEEKEELWKRTVVVFTTIDELKGCNSYEDRVNKLETQIAKPGMEKVKKLLDQTSTECIYVSGIDHLDKQRVVNDLNDKLRSIVPIKRIEDKSASIDHHLTEKHDESNSQVNSSVTVPNTNPFAVTDYLNDFATISKPAHVLTYQNNISTQGSKRHQSNGSLSNTDYPTPRTSHHDEASTESWLKGFITPPEERNPFFNDQPSDRTHSM